MAYYCTTHHNVRSTEACDKEFGNSEHCCNVGPFADDQAAIDWGTNCLQQRMNHEENREPVDLSDGLWFGIVNGNTLSICEIGINVQLRVEYPHNKRQPVSFYIKNGRIDETTFKTISTKK